MIKSRLFLSTRIKGKILVFSLLMSIIPFVILGLINIYTSQAKLENSIQRSHSIFVNNSVKEIEKTIEEILARLKLFRDNRFNSYQEKDDFFMFSTFLKNVPIAENIAWIDKDGKLLYKVDRRNVYTSSDFEIVSNNVMQVLNRNKEFLGNVRTVDSRLVMELAIPLYQDNQVKGGLLVNINLKSLFSKIVSKPIGESTTVYIFDNSSQLIGYKELSQKLTYNNQIAASSYSRILNKVNVTQDQPYHQKLLTINNIKVLSTIQKVPLTQWFVVLEQPEKDAFRIVRQLILNLTLFTLLTILFVSIISIVFALLFSKPIERIEKAVRKVAEGDLTQQIVILSNDEIGSLARSFNKMTKEIKEKSEGLLEEKKRLDMVVSGLGMGLMLIDKNFKPTWMNHTIKDWFSYDIQGFQSLTKEIIQECTKETFKECINEKFSCFNDLEGRQRHFRHQVFILNSGQENESYLEVVEEITAKREMELMVYQADKLAAIGILASGVSHEINNPLGILSVYSQDLKDRLGEEDIEKLYQSGEIDNYLKGIQMQIDRCKEITRNLLNFARKADNELEAASINEIIQEVIGFVQYKIKKGKIILESHLVKSMPLILTKKGEMQQVILNIVINALDALEDNPGKVQIRTRVSLKNVIIEIEDNGKGIKKEDLKRSFEPFYTTKPPGKGTGLGLSVVYGIIKNLGGNIKLESQLNKGTIVRIELPKYEEGE